MNVYEPAIRFLHHEAATRKSLDIPKAEKKVVGKLLAPYFANGDPFFNANLDPALRYPFPRVF